MQDYDIARWGPLLRYSAELVGTVAFALSGILAGMRKQMDIVGICVLGFLAAFGGGTLRDILLDRRPFFWVADVRLLWLVLGLCVASLLLLRGGRRPVSDKAIAERLPGETDVATIMTELQSIYEKRGVNLVRVGDAWAFRTAADLSFLMNRESVQQKKLSRAAMNSHSRRLSSAMALPPEASPSSRPPYWRWLARTR